MKIIKLFMDKMIIIQILMKIKKVGKSQRTVDNNFNLIFLLIAFFKMSINFFNWKYISYIFVF